MTIIYAAATAPVNPPGSSPQITLKQLWAGLELKARFVYPSHFRYPFPPLYFRTRLTPNSKPQLFLAVIDTCNVLSDDGDTVLREVKFKDGGGVGMGPVIGPKVKESITAIKPITVFTAASLYVLFKV